MFNKHYILYLWYLSLAFMKNYVIETVLILVTILMMIKIKSGILNFKVYILVITDINIRRKYIVNYALIALLIDNDNLISFSYRYKYQVKGQMLLKYIIN